MKKPLYIHRPLLNGKDVQEWAFENGFSSCIYPAEMHVTIAYSKTPLDWSEITKETSKLSVLTDTSQFEDLDKKVDVSLDLNGENRSIKPLGDQGAIVLKFKSDLLSDRWKELIRHGASWDYPNYQPHITLTYRRQKTNPNRIKPYRGELHFGPEIFKEIKEDWQADVREKTNPALRKSL